MQNGRYQLGTSENQIAILDTRKGIVFRNMDGIDWYSINVVKGAARTWQKVREKIAVTDPKKEVDSL